MFKRHKPCNFWVTGCARSGTTAIAQILNTAKKTKVTSEEPPQLHVECRALYDGVLESPKGVFYSNKALPKEIWNIKGQNYGDKNVNYVPFIPYIDEKIVFLIRDGRDVVRSLMNWDSQFHSIYSEWKRSNPTLGDYCRPRPLPDDPYYTSWAGMDLFGMCCWYWKEWNRLGLDLLKEKPKDQYYIVNMDTLDMNGVKELFEFLGLKGYNRKRIEPILHGKINSLQDRFDKQNIFPTYEDWGHRAKATFWNIAGNVWERIERLWLKGYNQQAKAMNLYFQDAPWFDLFMTERNFTIYQWIKRHISKDSSLLDAGAGWGSLPILLAKHGYENCTMNEIIPERIEHSRHLASKFGVTIKHIQGDMLQLKNPPKYDVIVSATWQHPDYPYEKVVEKFSSLLNPKGYLILTFWNEDGNIMEARREFLRHYTYPKDFGAPFPSIKETDLIYLFERFSLKRVDVIAKNTPPTPNMKKMRCSTPEHFIVGQKR